jgi:hypothetical protein
VKKIRKGRKSKTGKQFCFGRNAWGGRGEGGQNDNRKMVAKKNTVNSLLPAGWLLGRPRAN